MSATGKPLTVAVTGLNANDNPGPGIAVIRALKDAYGDTLKIVGLAYEALESGIYMKHLISSTYQLPYVAEGSAALLHRLLEVHEREQLDVVIPNFDAELVNFIKIAPGLQQAGIETFLPAFDQLAARDKVNLSQFASDYGFMVPQTVVINHEDDIYAGGETLEYPLMVKGRFYEAVPVYTPEAGRKAIQHVASRWGFPVIAQQFISGTEINVAGLGDGKGNLLGAVPMRKLYITEKGKAWAGVTIEDPELVTMASRFAAALQWKGGFELEVLRNREGQFYIIEINPRFPAWIYLAAVAGQNQPAALVKLALGQPVTPFEHYDTGKMFIRYSWDEIVDIADFQQFSAFGQR